MHARHPKLALEALQQDPAAGWTRRAGLISNSMGPTQAPPGLGVPPVPSYTETRRPAPSSSAAPPSDRPDRHERPDRLDRQDRHSVGTLHSRASSSSSVGAQPAPPERPRLGSRRSVSRTGSGSSLATEESEGSRLAIMHLRQLGSARLPELPPGLFAAPPSEPAADSRQASGELGQQRSGSGLGQRQALGEPRVPRQAAEPGRMRDSAAAAIMNIPAAQSQPGGRHRGLEPDWPSDTLGLRSLRLAQIAAHSRPGMPAPGASHPMQDDALKYAAVPSTHSLPLMQPATPILRHPPAASSGSNHTRSSGPSTGTSRSNEVSPEVLRSCVSLTMLDEPACIHPRCKPTCSSHPRPHRALHVADLASLFAWPCFWRGCSGEQQRCIRSLDYSLAQASPSGT